jgi:hypothetical protein
VCRTPGRTASRTSRTRVSRKGRRLFGTARPHRASAGTPSRQRAGPSDRRINYETTQLLRMHETRDCQTACRFSSFDHQTRPRATMLPLAPVAFPLTCPAVRPRGLGGASVAPDQATALARLENELERQVRPHVDTSGRSARENAHRPPLTAPPFSARAHPQGPGGRPAHRPENRPRLAHERHDPRPRRYHGVRGRRTRRPGGGRSRVRVIWMGRRSGTTLVIGRRRRTRRRRA